VSFVSNFGINLMFAKKKIIIGAMLFVIFAMASCAAFVNYVGRGLCDTTVVDQVSSPSKSFKAVIFQLDCGATTGFNSQVVIVSGDKTVSSNGALPDSFFVADSDRNDIPASKGGGPELRLTWTSDANLQIQHHELARIFRADTSSKGVGINYATYR
jgi:hypothetical protein